MKEEWRQIPSHPDYEASSKGRIRRRDTGRILKQREHGAGYRAAKLGAGMPQLIHRVVCEAFNGPCPDGMWCAHLNGNPSDNRPENLSWTTPKENQSHKRKHGTLLYGSKAPWAKLSEENIKSIRQEVRKGRTQREVGNEFGISQSMVSSIINGKRWRRT